MPKKGKIKSLDVDQPYTAEICLEISLNIG